MTEKVQCEIFLAINEDGDYQVGETEEFAAEQLRENIGGYVCRIVKIIAKVTPPQITETELDIPDEAGETTKVEAQAV